MESSTQRTVRLAFERMSIVATTSIVEAIDVHAWYGSSHVLHGVSLRIERGESVGLLGRNGMGKSTLIRTLLGHVTQRTGVIRIAGQDLSRGRPHQVARLGVAYVPEGRGVFPNLTVRENLVMAARGDGRSGWTLERTLKTFPRLAERLQYLGAQLSGGEQQMLAIGRALMTQPSLIMLDEATEGLAPRVVAEVWCVLEAIRRDGIATLIVDRDYRKVAAHSDRLVVLQKGQVALTGGSSELHRGDALASYLGV
jgi:branched-chain amino acid transport system ATP-binding protein